MTDLEPSSSDNHAYDVKVIGDSVFVAGSLTDLDIVDPGPHGVIWETDLNGNVLGRTDLVTAEYHAIRANALNNDGDVAGWGWEVGTVGRHGFLYESDSGVDHRLGDAGRRWKARPTELTTTTWLSVYGLVSPLRTTARVRLGRRDDVRVAGPGVGQDVPVSFQDANDVNLYGDIVGWGTVGRPNNLEDARLSGTARGWPTGAGSLR